MGSIFDLDFESVTPDFLESNGYKCTYKSLINPGRYEFIKRIEPFSRWIQLRVNIWDEVIQYQLEKFPPGENCRILLQTQNLNKVQLLVLEQEAKEGVIRSFI